MKNLFIFSDAPYGIERIFNGLRLAGALSKREGEEVRIILIGDAVSAAKKGQKLPPGFYNVETILKSINTNSDKIRVCGACLDARGIADTDILDGLQKNTLGELTDLIPWAEKVISF
jgi:uncharacterized protein involved in oxidation of intracellular sulfur